jgi:hypothetical protein
MGRSSGIVAAASTDRRASHNATERARREALNGKFMDLARINPILMRQMAAESTNSALKKPSKSQIVQRSLEYITFMQQRSERRDRLLAELATENDMLRAELNRYRLHTGAEILPERDEAVTEMIHRTEDEEVDFYLRHSSSGLSMHAVGTPPPTPHSISRRLSEAHSLYSNSGYPTRLQISGSFNDAGFNVGGGGGSGVVEAPMTITSMLSTSPYYHQQQLAIDSLAQSCPSQFNHQAAAARQSVPPVPINFQPGSYQQSSQFNVQQIPSALSGAIQRSRETLDSAMDDDFTVAEDDDSLMAGEDTYGNTAAEQQLLDQMLQFEE